MVARQSGGIPRRRAEPLGARNPARWGLRWGHRRALDREADFLDDVVDAQLEFILTLPVLQRDELARALAVLVMLAQDHRHCAQGWISRRELRHRVESSLGDLDVLLQTSSAGAALPRVD
jgi:hypothetical protein